MDIKNVATTLGIDVCMALIGMHTYTGCDTVSAFAGKGKAKVLKLLIKDQVTKYLFAVGSGMGPISGIHGPAGSFHLSTLCSQSTNIQGQ